MRNVISVLKLAYRLLRLALFLAGFLDGCDDDS